MFHPELKKSFYALTVVIAVIIFLISQFVLPSEQDVGQKDDIAFVRYSDTYEQDIARKPTYIGYRYFDVSGFLIERPVLIASVVYVVWFGLIALISFLRYLPFKKGQKINDEIYSCNDILYSNFFFIFIAFLGPVCMWFVNPNFGEGYGLILLAFFAGVASSIYMLYTVWQYIKRYSPILGAARTFLNVALFFVFYSALITYTAYSFDGYLY